tara:strand:+ start:249 stop:377 length:129 start_codon:yes stop_codon:yes gene_type:complete
MIKKILLALAICCMLFACGKKGDPVFEDPKKKAEVMKLKVSL